MFFISVSKSWWATEFQYSQGYTVKSYLKIKIKKKKTKSNLNLIRKFGLS